MVEYLLNENFEQYAVGDIVGQGEWALSEDQPEAPNKAVVVSPGLNGSQKAMSFDGITQGASKTFTRSVTSEEIKVEFDFYPIVFGKVLNVALRSGTTTDMLKGVPSAYLKIENGNFYHLIKAHGGGLGWAQFTGVSWSSGTLLHIIMIIDYINNTTRLEVNGALSPDIVSGGNWYSTTKPGLIDIKSSAVGSKLDDLKVYTTTTVCYVPTCEFTIS